MSDHQLTFCTIKVKWANGQCVCWRIANCKFLNYECFPCIDAATLIFLKVNESCQWNCSKQGDLN